MYEPSKLFYSRGLEPHERNSSPVLEASLLAAPPLRLGEAARASVAAGVDVLHVDVMDGRFGPEVAFGSAVIKALKREIGDAAPLDVHLLVEDVDRYVEAYLEAGADIVTICYETSDNPYKTLETIRKAGRCASLSLLPTTPISVLDELVPLLDLILIMAVHPGESRFLASVLTKVTRLREATAMQTARARIGVDGGIKNETLPSIMASGAEWIIAGSAIFGTGNIADNIGRLRELATLGS